VSSSRSARWTREIERIVRERRPGGSNLKVKVVLTAAGTNLNHVVEGEIEVT
jgi:hypothetical protein